MNVITRELLLTVLRVDDTLTYKEKVSLQGLTNQSELEEKLLSPHEAAQMLKCTTNTLRNWAKDGIIKPVILGKRSARYRLADVYKILDAKK